MPQLLRTLHLLEQQQQLFSSLDTSSSNHTNNNDKHHHHRQQSENESSSSLHHDTIVDNKELLTNSTSPRSSLTTTNTTLQKNKSSHHKSHHHHHHSHGHHHHHHKHKSGSLKRISSSNHVPITTGHSELGGEQSVAPTSPTSPTSHHHASSFSHHVESSSSSSSPLPPMRKRAMTATSMLLDRTSQSTSLTFLILLITHAVFISLSCIIGVSLFRHSRGQEGDVILFHFYNFNELFSWRNFNPLMYQSVHFDMDRVLNSGVDGSFEIRTLKSNPTVNQNARHLYALNYSECNQLNRGQDLQYWAFFLMPGSELKLNYELYFAEFRSEMRLAILEGTRGFDCWMKQASFSGKQRCAQVDTFLLTGRPDMITVSVIGDGTDNNNDDDDDDDDADNGDYANNKVHLSKKSSDLREDDRNFLVTTQGYGRPLFFIVYFASKEHNYIASCSLSFKFNMTTFDEPDPSNIKDTCLVTTSSSCDVSRSQTVMITARTASGEQADKRGQIVSYSFNRDSLNLFALSSIPLVVLLLIDTLVGIVWAVRFCRSRSSFKNRSSITINAEESSALLQS